VDASAADRRAAPELYDCRKPHVVDPCESASSSIDARDSTAAPFALPRRLTPRSVVACRSQTDDRPAERKVLGGRRVSCPSDTFSLNEEYAGPRLPRVTQMVLGLREVSRSKPQQISRRIRGCLFRDPC